MTREPQAVGCQSCNLRSLCLPVILADNEIAELDEIVSRNTTIEKGEYLFRAGDHFDKVFALRSGCVKNVLSAFDGSEQIISFHLPGELAGLDSIDNGVYAKSSIAVQRTSICSIPFAELEQLSRHIPGLQRQLLSVLSRELRQDQEQMLLLGKRSAAERLAAFLVNLSVRFSRRKLSSQTFQLPMQIKDVGNHLGLTQETMSRLLKRLRTDGLLEMKGREIRLLSMPRMVALAGATCEVPITIELPETLNA